MAQQAKKDCSLYLRFLKNFLASNGMTMAEAANIIGVSQVNLAHLLSVKYTQEGIKMSYIEKIIESRGYVLRVNIFRAGDEDKADVEVNAIDRAIDGNLKFHPVDYLKLAMKRYGYCRADLAKLLELNPGTIRYWTDINRDITFPRLLQCADAMNCNVQFSIEPAESYRSSTQNGTRMFIVKTVTNFEEKL